LHAARGAGADVAADVAAPPAAAAPRPAGRGRARRLRPAEPTRAGVDGVAAARSVPDADRRARLHRHAGDPVDPRLEAHDVTSAREDVRDGGGVADGAIDADVRWGLLVQASR